MLVLVFRQKIFSIRLKLSTRSCLDHLDPPQKNVPVVRVTAKVWIIEFVE